MRNVQKVIAAVLVFLVLSDSASGVVVEYQHSADQWMADVGQFEAWAFDEYAPGQSTESCIAFGTVQLALVGGTIDVSSHDQNGQLQFAIYDGSGVSSGGFMVGPIGGNTPVVLRLEFDPAVPVTGAIARFASTSAGLIGGPVPRDHEQFEIEEYFPQWWQRLELMTYVQCRPMRRTRSTTNYYIVS